MTTLHISSDTSPAHGHGPRVQLTLDPERGYDKRLVYMVEMRELRDEHLVSIQPNPDY